MNATKKLRFDEMISTIERKKKRKKNERDERPLKIVLQNPTISFGTR